MTYNSPFDALLKNNPKWVQNIEYRGTLDDVLSALDKLSPQHSSADTLVWALYPPRIIGAFVDSKIRYPSNKIEDLLRDAINTALSVYSEPAHSHEYVSRLREELEATKYKALLTLPLARPCDIRTWQATHPLYSEKSAHRIAEQTQSNDILFIALAHGGVAAGMDVYLRYCDSRSQNSAFYTARFSIHKLMDKQPQLTSRELEHLKWLAQGRQVVVFDEDIGLGETIHKAHSYFSYVFQPKKVMTITNLNALQ